MTRERMSTHFISIHCSLWTPNILSQTYTFPTVTSVRMYVASVCKYTHTWMWISLICTTYFHLHIHSRTYTATHTHTYILFTRNEMINKITTHTISAVQRGKCTRPFFRCRHRRKAVVAYASEHIADASLVWLWRTLCRRIFLSSREKCVPTSTSKWFCVLRLW